MDPLNPVVTGYTRNIWYQSGDDPNRAVEFEQTELAKLFKMRARRRLRRYIQRRIRRHLRLQHQIKVRCIVSANLIGGRRFVQKAIQRRGKLPIYVQKFVSRRRRLFHIPRPRCKSYNWLNWTFIGGKMFLIMNDHHLFEQMSGFCFPLITTSILRSQWCWDPGGVQWIKGLSHRLAAVSDLLFMLEENLLKNDKDASGVQEVTRKGCNVIFTAVCSYHVTWLLAKMVNSTIWIMTLRLHLSVNSAKEIHSVQDIAKCDQLYRWIGNLSFISYVVLLIGSHSLFDNIEPILEYEFEIVVNHYLLVVDMRVGMVVVVGCFGKKIMSFRTCSIDDLSCLIKKLIICPTDRIRYWIHQCSMHEKFLQLQMIGKISEAWVGKNFGVVLQLILSRFEVKIYGKEVQFKTNWQEELQSFCKFYITKCAISSVYGASGCQRMYFIDVQFFWATIPRKVESLTREILLDHVRVTVGEIGMANEDITQVVHVIPCDNEKMSWLLENLPGMLDQEVVLVFASKKVIVDEILSQLSNKGFNIAALHGDKDQTSQMGIL